MTTYAINIADLTALQQCAEGLNHYASSGDALNARMMLLLLNRYLNANSTVVVEAERNRAVGIGDALVLDCTPEQGAAVAELIASKRPKRSATPRLYVSQTGRGGWRRI